MERMVISLGIQGKEKAAPIIWEGKLRESSETIVDMVD
jgi:hypothetical protein